jgi:hypothetical protein
MESSSYWDILHKCVQKGDRVTSRAGAVRELLNVQMVVHPLAIPRRVKMRRELGYMEFLQLITGAYDKEEIKRVAPRVNLDLFGKAAIYGPRVWLGSAGMYKDQISEAMHELRENPHSRRAIIMVHDPLDDLGNEPCVTSFQFHVRRNCLHTTINVRSWDLWFGAPHDLIVMSGLAQLMMECLKLKHIGPMVINAANAHIYEMSVGDVGGGSVYWSFNLTPNGETSSAYILDHYRNWAWDQRQNPSWTHGAPTGIAEHFPKLPNLQAMKVSPVLEGIGVEDVKV